MKLKISQTHFGIMHAIKPTTEDRGTVLTITVKRKSGVTDVMEKNHTENSCRYEQPIRCNTCGQQGHKAKRHSE